MSINVVLGNVVGWFLAILFFAIGFINTFWGNDTIFGIGIAVLSLIYIPGTSTLTKKLVGFSIPVVVKIVLALFILWAALGVGELFDKTGMMLKDLR
jgi:hypothetical protein